MGIHSICKMISLELRRARGRSIVTTVATVLVVVSTSHAETTTITTIDDANIQGYHTAIKAVDGKISIAYFYKSYPHVRFWWDNGAGSGTASDFSAHADEIQAIANGQGHDLTSLNNQAVISMCQFFSNAYRLYVWVDDGNGGGVADNGLDDGSELRQIVASGGAGILEGRYSSATAVGTKLAIASAAETDGDLKLWYDDGAGAGVASNITNDGSEYRTIDANIGDYAGEGRYIAITSLSNNLAIAYYDQVNGDLELWYDDGRGGGVAGDGNANGTELRTIDATNDVGKYVAITTVSSRLAVSYYDETNDDLRVWIDDGYSAGTAGDGLANGGEIRTIESTGSIGLYTSATINNSRLAISYYDSTNSNLKLWYDDGNSSGTAGDGLANGGEIRTVDSDCNTGYYTSITSLSNELFISYHHVKDSGCSWSQDLKMARITFNANPTTPSSLGPTAHANGSNITEKSPQATFTLSDTDSGDTVKYQIQIDDSSDFSSAVVDYTSALAAQGATSFTVGQAAGSGSYTTGSASQELAAGSYYWRVKAIDNSAAESSWATANSGSVAFVVTEPTVDFSAATYSGAEDGGAVTVTVNLSGSSDEQVTVNYASSNGTATAGTDYTAASGTLTFSPSDTSETFTITPTSDSGVENDETVTLTLSSPHDATLAGVNNPATLTITNDDTAGVTITHISPKTVGEGNSHSYSVVLNSQPTNDVTISVTADSVTSASPSSFTFTSGNWNTAQSGLIIATEDTIPIASSYSSTLTLGASSSDSNYNNISINSIELLINDNDVASNGGGGSNEGGDNQEDNSTDEDGEASEDSDDSSDDSAADQDSDSDAGDGNGDVNDENAPDQPDITERGELEEIEALSIGVESDEEVEIEIETEDGASASVMIGANNSIGGGTVSVTLYEERVSDDGGSGTPEKKVPLTLKVEAPPPAVDDDQEQDQRDDAMTIEMVISMDDLDAAGLNLDSARLVRWNGSEWVSASGNNIGQERPTGAKGEQGHFVDRQGLVHMWATVSLRELFAAQLSRASLNDNNRVITEYSVAQVEDIDEGSDEPEEEDSAGEEEQVNDEDSGNDDVEDDATGDEDEDDSGEGAPVDDDLASGSGLCGLGSLGASAALYAALMLLSCLSSARRRP